MFIWPLGCSRTAEKITIAILSACKVVVKQQNYKFNKHTVAFLHLCFCPLMNEAFYCVEWKETTPEATVGIPHVFYECLVGNSINTEVCPCLTKWLTDLLSYTIHWSGVVVNCFHNALSKCYWSFIPSGEVSGLGNNYVFYSHVEEDIWAMDGLFRWANQQRQEDTEVCQTVWDGLYLKEKY